MGYAAGGPPAFHRAREVAGAAPGGGPARRTAARSSPTSAPRTPGVPRGRGDAPRGALGRRPSALPLTDTHAAWPAVLDGVDEVVQSCTYPTRQLTIVTDLRKAGWDAGVARDRPALAASRASASGWWTSAPTRSANVALRVARPARPDDPRRRREPLGGGDPQRLAAGAQPGPRRSSGWTTGRPR